jgi:hypothetical protein
MEHRHNSLLFKADTDLMDDTDLNPFTDITVKWREKNQQHLSFV